MLDSMDNNQTNSIRVVKNLLGYLQIKPLGGLGAAFIRLIHIAKKLYYKIQSAKFKFLLEIFNSQNFNQNLRKITRFLYIVQVHSQEYRKVS